MMASDLPALRAYPFLRGFIQVHLDMQVNDVRTMLQLPRVADGLTGGCNFAAVSWLCNLLSGFSELLYVAGVPRTGTRRRKDARRAGVASKFIGLLVSYYPWDATERRQAPDQAGVLYHLARTPLTHYLGVGQKKGSPRLNIAKPKVPLTPLQLELLERSSSRPTGLPLALTRERGAWVLDVAALYWGVFQLLRALTEDAAQMRLAEARFEARAKRRR